MASLSTLNSEFQVYEILCLENRDNGTWGYLRVPSDTCAPAPGNIQKHAYTYTYSNDLSQETWICTHTHVHLCVCVNLCFFVLLGMEHEPYICWASIVPLSYRAIPPVYRVCIEAVQKEWRCKTNVRVHLKPHSQQNEVHEFPSQPHRAQVHIHGTQTQGSSWWGGERGF